MPSITTIIAAGLAGLLAVPLLAFSGAAGNGTAGGCVPAEGIYPAAMPPIVPRTDDLGGHGHDAAAGDTAASDTVWDDEQTGNAALVIAVGQARGVPAWGHVVAVATAMQESRLRNLPGGDRDSIGLFQQRPSAGWGTPTQLRSPAYQAGKFYDALLAVPGWQTMPLTQASQHVQRSAFPNAYARWTRPAITIVTQLSDSHPQGASTGTGSTATPGTGCIPGQAVLARAATWLTAWQGGPVLYSMSTDPAASFQGYRRDCSGYASMALGLPAPGLDTAGLAARSTPIDKADLAPGDLLINPAPGGGGHVVIFDHWTDATMTAYVGYEQSGDGGTHHRAIPYPYFGGHYPMIPFRCCAR